MNRSTIFRNVLGVALACIVMVGWVFRDEVGVAVTGTVAPSFARKGLNIMATGAESPEVRTVARKYLSAAAQADSRDPLALFGLGWIDQLDGNRAAAKTSYESAISQLQELLHFARFNQSLVLEAEGDLRGAYEEIRLLLRLDPKNEAARARQEDLIRKLSVKD
jgi:tetratricopeptide (TPR) repeat protein